MVHHVYERAEDIPLGVGATGEKEVVSKYVHSEAQEAVQRQLRVPPSESADGRDRTHEEEL
eukprot:CAMPEP_0113266022 /NCGR_PEP_ID=MMETSP0008_2-20120614/19832_1 /TAXON_ID=97485 /ORGANISM="Prymnesium parvum" /LENGTH=60 /DNA_ID=CAMNT_0000114917 /DNA_START=245 /DNA_END=427 /DNA_ORIENTATION=- /assembly_acc=CAM_ASM_000153